MSSEFRVVSCEQLQAFSTPRPLRESFLVHCALGVGAGVGPGYVCGARSTVHATARACSFAHADAMPKGPRCSTVAGRFWPRPQRMHMRPCHRQAAHSTKPRSRLARVKRCITGAISRCITVSITSAVVISNVESRAHLSTCLRDALHRILRSICATCCRECCAACLKCSNCTRLQLNVQLREYGRVVCQCSLEPVPRSAYAAITQLDTSAPMRRELAAHTDPPQASARSALVDDSVHGTEEMSRTSSSDTATV